MSAAPTLPDGRVRCDRTTTWAALGAHFESDGRAFDLRAALAEPDAGRARVAEFGIEAPWVYGDLSKNLVDAKTKSLLCELARECGLEAHRDAMFAGDRINGTENRAVGHVFLRKPGRAQEEWTSSAIKNIANASLEGLEQVGAVLDSMLGYAERVRADASITDVVNIGIGGSDLGPQMATLALGAFAAPGKRFHFVSNIDGEELAGVLRGLRPASTLFLVASKTFTTIETMTNAHSAKDWFEREGGTDVAAHFAALTTNLEAARAFGIETTFGFRDWVGGRYSLWSAIGLPLAIAIGAEGFRAMLAGAHAMDGHFRTAPLERNLPAQLGLVDVWYRNFHRFTSRSVAPYSSALRRLPAYLQQLEMESNGKRVDAAGEALPFSTSPVVWGEPGTNGQHAYFQMLHQGTDVVPVEFVAVKSPANSLTGHHAKLLANVLAQAQALMTGKADAGPPQVGSAPSGGSEPRAAGSVGATISDAGGHRHFPGNRPSTLLLLDALTPGSFGALIALQEHRVFTSGSLWGINSFDQWGVELGKVLAKDVEARLGSGDADGLDASTADLLMRLRA